MKSIYKDNFVYLKNLTQLIYETLGEYQHLWFNLIKPVNPPLEREYEDDEELPGIQKKGHLFLSELYRLCKEDQSKEFNMYEIGERLGFDEFETELIVENLANSELISHQKSSDEVSITPYGIMTIKGEIRIGYAPVH
ncbi:MAG TPA: hypothetical protein VI935_00990 [Thermodesulfobacteriota bacterium]|nr:hypothetical protein [Thermodesulfobacteriota bacterium]